MLSQPIIIPKNPIGSQEMRKNEFEIEGRIYGIYKGVVNYSLPI